MKGLVFIPSFRDPILKGAEEKIMPVTYLVTLIVAVLALGGLTIWAFIAWGAMTVIPMLLVVALLARWAMTPVAPDDTHA